MKRVNHDILPKKHPRKKSTGVRSRHNSFYERVNLTFEDDSYYENSSILPLAGREYGFAYESVWDLNAIEKK